MSLLVLLPALDHQVSTGSTVNQGERDFGQILHHSCSLDLSRGPAPDRSILIPVLSCQLRSERSIHAHSPQVLLGCRLQAAGSELPEPLSEEWEAVDVSSLEHGIITTTWG